MTSNHTVTISTADGYHTLNVDAPLRIFWPLVNLRDSHVEDNVRKRPFIYKTNPYALASNLSTIVTMGQTTITLQRKTNFIEYANFCGIICESEIKKLIFFIMNYRIAVVYSIDAILSFII